MRGVLLGAMRRTLIALIALSLLALPAAARADAPRPRVAVQACQTGQAPAERVAAFVASMPAGDDTVRMAMRFDLQQRTVDGGVWERVVAPSFGRWERSRTGVAGFVYAKDVHGLSAPGEYRAIVRLRWYARDGSVRELRRVTRSCRQPDPRPDLVAGRLQVLPVPDTPLATYRLPVRNTGRGAAGPFAVALRLGGAEVARAVVGGLAPGATSVVVLQAPACAAGAPVELAIDADGTVAEADEDDAVIRPPCRPAAG
jgi:hypothetical protein